MLYDPFNDKNDPFVPDEEDDLCPLCVEEMDITDKNFWPCPCGYQVCQFCYNNIRTNPELNGKCPACRRPYDDKNVVHKSVSPEEWKMNQARKEKQKRERRQVEKEKKDAEQAKRHHLAGMRVIQQNLVYVVGLNPPCSADELPSVLRSDKYFGQYGKISKIVINKRTPNPNNPHHTSPGYGVYVTFARKEDAARCIAAVDGSISDGRVLKAAHGTTKYCSSYLRGQPCPNPNCMFLHEPGEEADSYTRKDLSTRAINKKFEERSAVNGLIPPPASQNDTDSSSYQDHSPAPSSAVPAPSSAHEDENNLPGLPPTAAWAKLQQTQSQMSNLGLGPSSVSDLSSAPAALSAFPTLGDAILQKPVKTPSVQTKKKDRGKETGVVEDSLYCYKLIDDCIKLLNNQQEVSYAIKPSMRRSNVQSSFHLFSTEEMQKSMLSEGDNKQHMSRLVDSLLFAPFSKNYNYKTAALQEPAKPAQPTQPAQTSIQHQFYQPQPQRYPNNILQGGKQPVQSTQSAQQFLQQQLLQEQKLKALRQDKPSTATPPPPGLFPAASADNIKTTNSAELLSQLMGGKKLAV
ncbi:hypothetical protein KL921_004552 [Ogataea angusta]|uniref:General negative regulator of transcription subunit 4 n=1 Tax=Pichia angusta TaxID=870730 RepID=A0AAN6DD76_PICAN|nr:uncharacterized protein KL928_004908 [Ogataea angusta]KAG7807128.1 hypothetical protein KL921_004552 [Ogataea angusta]KAG7816352.1 hypothetical protein KL928_004908 [Ogataea angusta]KAG7827322.1 hypothetical protein KL920_004576 [Ogataea angusta]KAG7843602.1 hypothetical protein KL941_004584 [Ogataea angusta]KAG7855594.1 hypothetical protein KL919_004734 [Ogataea angusta]